MKKTLVIGASLNPSRYSNIAIHKLVGHEHEVKAMGLKIGTVAGVPITNEMPSVQGYRYHHPLPKRQKTSSILSLYFIIKSC